MNRRLLRLLLLVGSIAAAAGSMRWLSAHGLTGVDLVAEVARGGDPRFSWESVDKKHWQASSMLPGESTATTDARERNGQGCPAGMVRVKGAFHRDAANGRATGLVERLQDAACTDWISRDFPARCRTYDAAKITEAVAKVPTDDLDFCMDRFEYPNVFGQNPMIVVTFREAEAICRKSDKRLCTENEWTFACEGEEARPYPYGYTRDDEACVIDRAWRPFVEGALQPRDGEKARAELDRLWQGEPSGSRPACRSPFGVYDMTGNVDEWTRSVNATGYASVLKGGYWGPVRARCRPATRAHNEDFVAYQQSFRCCAAATDAAEPEPENASPADTDASIGEAVMDDGTALATSDDVAPQALPSGPESGDDEIAAIQRARSIGCHVGATGVRRPVEPIVAIALVLFGVRRAQRKRTSA